MMNQKIVFGLFAVLGIGIGIGWLIGRTADREFDEMRFYGGNQTTFYVANRDIQLEGGSTITEGTKLRLDRHMPEGFTRLSLAVNTEGSDAFQIQRGGRPNEISPVWTITQAQHVGAGQSATTGSSEMVDGAALFVAWAANVEFTSEGRIAYSSVDRNYRSFVALLPQTKEILELEGAPKAEVLNSLMNRYKLVLTKEVETSESDQYLGLLYCSIKGLAPTVVAGCTEAGTYNLDRALGERLFGVIIENPWKSIFERSRDRRSDSDPYADPFAVQK